MLGFQGEFLFAETLEEARLMVIGRKGFIPMDGDSSAPVVSSSVVRVPLMRGAGQIGMAIARRMGTGMKIVVGDKKLENAQAIADIMNGAGCGVGQTRGTAERHCARHHCNTPCHR